MCEAVVLPWYQSAAKLIHYIHIYSIKSCLATNTPARSMIIITHQQICSAYKRLSSIPCHPQEIDLTAANCSIYYRIIDTECWNRLSAELWWN